MTIDCTLVADGSSDRMLIPVLRWCLTAVFPDLAFNIEFASVNQFLSAEARSLENRITLSLDLFPCDILFLHRDAERESFDQRLAEIQEAVEKAPFQLPLWVPVIPIRMSEAWLLIDNNAIRFAAGNPNGQVPLSLPPVRKLEELPDPKETPLDLLKTATELNKRRIKKFNAKKAIHNVASQIEDYSIVEGTFAFSQLREAIKKLDLERR